MAADIAADTAGDPEPCILSHQMKINSPALMREKKLKSVENKALRGILHKELR